MTPILPSAHVPPQSQRAKVRRPYRVPVGLPKSREDWRMGSVFSALVHLAIVILLLSPFAMLGNISEIGQGAGGAGPAGGGGGGNRGTGRLRAEMLRFVTVAPPPPAPVATPTVVPPVKPPVVPPTPMPQVAVTKEPDTPMPVGIGGGSGTDLTGRSEEHTSELQSRLHLVCR